MNMWHFIRVYTVCLDKNDPEIHLYGKCNLGPLDIYNGQSQVYCIKLEGSTNWLNYFISVGAVGGVTGVTS